MPFSLLKDALATGHRQTFAARFAWSSRSWRDASDKRPEPTRIVVSGFFNDVLGIGQAGRLSADALVAAGFDVIREDLRPLDRGLLTRPPIGLPQAPVWLIHANPPEARIALFRHAHDSWKNAYRIGYWVWESSVAPAHWVDTARWFHEIWTPSQSAYDALAAAFDRQGQGAYITKLRIVPHPVPVLPLKARASDSLPVRALTLFDPRSDFDRKNPLGAIEAWIRAFPAPSHGHLTVKSLATAAGHPHFEALQRLAAGRGDIEIRAETLTAMETAGLVAHSDILVSLHRAEGFGLTLAEAMAGGLTAVATGWSGNMQFMTDRNAMPIPYRLAPANRAYNGPHAQWADPDIMAAAAALRQIVGDAALRRRLGEQARSDIARLSAGWTAGALFA